MEDYIFLDRRFVEFDPKVEGERDNYSFAIASLFSDAKSWQHILEQPCTVIVAEAGNGKTFELRHQTLDRALEGAEMLAATVTFSRRTSILVPDQPVDEALKARSIDPVHVLRKWTPEEIQALLGRALFDESLYGTVRFHHRTAREYLTASWLRRLLKNRKNRRKVESLLFAKPYGTQSEVVIPSM
jgi:hypothetical protein